jgi:hypothetical protein
MVAAASEYLIVTDLNRKLAVANWNLETSQAFIENRGNAVKRC